MAIDVNSKADTVFLSRSAGGGLTVDLSQYHMDLTDEGGGIFTSTDNRFNVSSPRELSILIDANASDEGFLLYYGDEDWNDASYVIRVASGTVVFYIGTSDIGYIDMPNVGAFDKEYLIHWSTVYDAQTTIYVSELAVCEKGTETWQIKRVYHTAPADNPDWTFCLTGFWWDPSTVYTNTITAVRLGRRFHSTVEAREDWVSTSADPIIYGVSPEAMLHGTIASPFALANTETLVDAVADTHSFAGPAHFWAATSSYADRMRLCSPIVNVGPNSPMELSAGGSASAWHTDAPSGTYRMPLSYLFSRPIPGGCDAARVRLHIQGWRNGGYPMGTSMDVVFRVFAMSKLPGQPGALVWQQSSTATVSTDHGSSGVGGWYDLGILNFSVGPFQICHFAVGYHFPSTTGSSYKRCKIKHVTIEPIRTS